MKISSVFAGLALAFISISSSSGEAYHLNPGDILSISVWNEEALQQEVMVLPDGTISFPLVGIIEAADRTLAEVLPDGTVELIELS